MYVLSKELVTDKTAVKIKLDDFLDTDIVSIRDGAIIPVLNTIKHPKTDKGLKSILKKSLPVMYPNYYQRVLTIDWDYVGEDNIDKLAENVLKHYSNSCVLLQRSVSNGGLFGLFKTVNYKEEEVHKKCYTKLYLDMMSKLDVEIDWLPDMNRARFYSPNQIYHKKEYSDVYQYVDQYNRSMSSFIPKWSFKGRNEELVETTIEETKINSNP